MCFGERHLFFRGLLIWSPTWYLRWLRSYFASLKSNNSAIEEKKTVSSKLTNGREPPLERTNQKAAFSGSQYLFVETVRDEVIRE